MFEDFTLSSYAPAVRFNNGQLSQQSELIAENKILVEMINSISQMVVILNQHRQIVYANKSFIDFCNTNMETVLGKRPGEAINCKNSLLSPAGCGTSEFCKTCGAVNAILESQKGVRATKECNILTGDNQAFELEVTSAPFNLKHQDLTVFSITDISAQKRRQSLERVFLHDILNSAGGISGLSAIISEIDDLDEIKSLAQTLAGAAQNLVEEIKVQRELRTAEQGELKPELKPYQSLNILLDLKSIYCNHELNQGKPIIIHSKSKDEILMTDVVLLKRILGNMIKNAMEINLPNDRIILKCEEDKDHLTFSVHNNSVIPIKVQPELFKRTFSTKGVGRGLGTYSMKLLGEKYLGGCVGFKSNEEDGTTFYIRLTRTI